MTRGWICWLLIAYAFVASDAPAQDIGRMVGRSGAVSAGTPSTPSISDGSPLPPATENRAYTYQFNECTGGTAPYTWTQPSGTLPSGVTFTGATRTLAGTPATGTPGVYTFAIRCTDSSGSPLSDTETFQLSVGYGTPAFTNGATLTGGTEAVAYAGGSGVTLVCTGGLAPYTYTIIGGALPPGLTLTTATIGGTPTTAGSYSFTAQCQDSVSALDTEDFSITISAASSGDIAGTGPDDYFEAIRAWNNTSAGGGTLTVLAMPYKGAEAAANIAAYGVESATNGHSYDGMGTVDATEINTTRYVEDVVYRQERFFTYTSGELAFVFDEYQEKSWPLGALTCMGSGQITAHKAWQIRQGNNSGGATIGIEPRHSYAGGDIDAKALTSITASGGTAIATCSGSCGFTNGENVTIAGPTNQITIPVASTTTGQNPVVTTVSPHGLTGTFPVLWAVTGETPNLANPRTHFSGTVTGASEITLTAQVPPASTLTVGGTGGNLIVYPYSALSTPITTIGSTQFSYAIPSATYSTAATGTRFRAVDDDRGAVTGTVCNTWDVRHYALLTDTATVTDDQPLSPTATSVSTLCDTWNRILVVVRFNDLSSPWTCTSAVDGSKVSGYYDLTSVYVVRQDGTKTQLFQDARLEFDRLTGINPATGNSANVQRKTSNGVTSDTCTSSPYTNLTLASAGRLRSIYNEMDSSAGGCYLGHWMPRRMYHRNWLVVHSSASGVIVPGENTLTVNGVDILRSPHP